MFTPLTAAPASGIAELDVCGLEPPEPMVRILDALDLLGPGDRLRVLIDRAPLPLYRVLAENGFGHSFTAQPDGRFEIAIWLVPPRPTNA